MTVLTTFYIASFVGAIVFFIAGAAAMSLRMARRAALPAQPEDAVTLRQPLAVQPAVIDTGELIARAERAEAASREHLARAERAEAASREQQRGDRQVRADADRVARAEAATREQRARAERAEAASREHLARAERAEASSREQLARIERMERAEAERVQRAEAATREQQVRIERAEADATAANERCAKLRDEVERMRSETVGSSSEATRAAARVQELEQQLAERTHAVRDLSTEVEQLKGRLRDAEGLRAEYVRLRTATVESEYLKSEIARLEGEIRTLKVDALAGKPQQVPIPRPARVTGLQGPANSGAPRTISESLLGVLEKFVQASTRSVAVSDMIGFPLASTGEDAQALAAYATLLADAASRADQFVPFARPVSVEVVDDRGVRLALWPFDVAGDRLLLTSLSVGPVEAGHVTTTLASLGKILAPSGAIAS